MWYGEGTDGIERDVTLREWKSKEQDNIPNPKEWETWDFFLIPFTDSVRVLSAWEI